ncbi:MAG: LysR family transcriptional regulator [Pseudomonadota bacterium]
MKTPFSLDALMTFHEVVDCASLTRASANLGLAKSTVSRQLASLEKQTGAMLLKRSTRHVTPTEIGAQLFESCKPIVRAARELDRMVDANRNTVAGTLKVSLPNEFGAGWMGKAIADFATEYPEMRLQVHVSAQMPNLLQEPFDVAIAFGKLRDSELICKRLATLAQGMFTSPQYLQKHGEPKNFKDLLQHEFITYQAAMRDGVMTVRDKGFQREIKLASRLEVNSVRLARDMVVSGIGISILPFALCRRYVETGALVRVLSQWQAPLVQVSAIVLARSGMPKKTRTFLDFVAERINVQESAAQPDVDD